MEIKKEDVKLENQESRKKDGAKDAVLKEKESVKDTALKAKESATEAASKEKDLKTPAKDSPAIASGEAKVLIKPENLESQKKESAKVVAPKEKEQEKPVKAPAIASGETKAKEEQVLPELTKSKELLQTREKESVRPLETAAAPAQATGKPESTMEVNLNILEKKIIRNIEKFKVVDEKIQQTEDEIEEILEGKTKKTVNKIIYFLPKICVEANVCRLPKAVCKACRKMVDVGLSAGRSGAKSLGELTGKCADSLSGGVRLPILRMKINKKFAKVGDCAYQMYLGGRKDVMKNDEIEKCIEEVKGFEKEIEELEKRGSNRVNEQAVLQEPGA